MDVKLVWEKGGKRRQVFQMRGDEMVVGRQSGSGLRIPSSEVSRVHCRLCREEGYVTIEDCASANGTFVNDEAIIGRQVLYPGDRVRVGPVTLTVEYQMTQETLDRLRSNEEEPLEEVGAESGPPVVELDEEDDEALEVRPAPVVAEEEDFPVVELDDEEPWQPPNPDELRDILSQLEDSE